MAMTPEDERRFGADAFDSPATSQHRPARANDDSSPSSTARSTGAGGLNDRLSDEVQAQINAELEPGEKVVWEGRPNPNRMMLKAMPIMLFGIPFLSFSIFWMAMAGGIVVAKGPRLGPQTFFVLFGLPFVLVGLGMVTSPLLFRWKATRTAYVVTDRRAIMFEGGVRTTIRSFTPDQLGQITRNQRADGSGDIIFREEVRIGRNGTRHITRIGFLEIPEVRDVERLIRALDRNATTKALHPRRSTGDTI
jgi:hypothetical protein